MKIKQALYCVMYFQALFVYQYDNGKLSNWAYMWIMSSINLESDISLGLFFIP